MKVQLEEGVWLAEGIGDPPRTIIESHATEFKTIDEALIALADARKTREFKNAQIQDDLF